MRHMAQPCCLLFSFWSEHLALAKFCRIFHTNPHSIGKPNHEGLLFSCFLFANSGMAHSVNLCHPGLCQRHDFGGPQISTWNRYHPLQLVIILPLLRI